jgi:hypothetical protein
MPFSEDGHAVGHLGAGGENEPFRVGVRLLASWRDLAHGDAGGGQRGVEGGSELPGSITDEDLNWSARSPRSVSRFRVCWVVHGPSGLLVTPRMCTYRLPTSMTKNTYRRWRVSVRSRWKK